MDIQSCLRLAVFFVVSGAVTCIPLISRATPVQMPGRAFIAPFTLVNAANRDVEDYHIEVSSPGNPGPPALIRGHFAPSNSFDVIPVQSANVTNDGVHTIISINVSDNPTKLKGSLEFVSLENKLLVTASYWTVKDIEGKPARIPPEDGGNACCPPGHSAVSDTVYTIFNDLDVSMNISGLQFLQNVPEILFALDASDLLPGFGPTVPDFTLSPHTSRIFDLGGTVDPGNWLYAQGLVSGEVFRFGHEAPVPEPSTLLLLGSTLAGLGGFAWRRHRRK